MRESAIITCESTTLQQTLHSIFQASHDHPLNDNSEKRLQGHCEAIRALQEHYKSTTDNESDTFIR